MIAEYLVEPWKKVHQAYADSVMHMRPAPEFATGEVVLSSVYRRVGFSQVSEGEVPKLGRDLEKRTQRKRQPALEPSQVSDATWRSILRGILDSPRQPNQSARRSVQFTPLVPDAALYSGSARSSGNSWNPGQLIERVIGLGADSPAHAGEVWSELYRALSVGDGDDVWARWISDEFARWRPIGTVWEPTSPDWLGMHAGQVIREAPIPARCFVEDLSTILLAKSSMTRRQWISVLEAVLRLGAVAHVMWVCDVNHRCWEVVRAAVLAGGSYGPETWRRVVSGHARLLRYGAPYSGTARDIVSNYLSARLGLNLTLYYLDAAGVEVPVLQDADSFGRFMDAVERHKGFLVQSGFAETFARLQDDQARTLACKKGIGVNVTEFVRHVLGRRVAAAESQRGYDQGYSLRKRGEYSSAPWIVSLGPVAVLALVHCCLNSAPGPRTVEALRRHMHRYGIEAHLEDMGHAELGYQLRTLGLVLDSPDAESGMLLVDPFPRANDLEVS